METASAGTPRGITPVDVVFRIWQCDRENHGRAFSLAVKSVSNEKEYCFPSLAGPDDRAIAGLSMGGGQTVSIGFTHLDKFHSIGIFSAGGCGSDPVKQFPDLLTDGAATNKKMKVIWVCAGDKDFALAGAEALDKTLTAHDVKHSFTETPGVHEWKVWRFALHEFAPLLFQ